MALLNLVNHVHRSRDIVFVVLRMNRPLARRLWPISLDRCRRTGVRRVGSRAGRRGACGPPAVRSESRSVIGRQVINEEPVPPSWVQN